MTINRILIIGLGSIGKRHLRLARQLLPDSDIRVLRHQECVSVPEYADGCFSSLELAIAFGPQLAVIANPATCHMQVALPLVRAGVHLMIEKPLSASLDDLPQLLEIARSQSAVLATGYNLRFLPSMQHFRERLHEGLIGRVLSVRCEIGQYLPSWRPDADYRQGVSAQRELGGGALLELSHEIDYVRWIFGEIDWVTATLSRQSDLDIDVEDTAHLLFGFAPTAPNPGLIASVNLDFIRHDTTRLCTAIGENGSLRWNGLSGDVEYHEPGAKTWQVIFSYPHQRDDSYLAEWRHVLSCLNDGTAPLVSGEDGLSVMQVIMAARLASDKCCKVRMTEVSNPKKESA
ncbi:MAG: hypothetical protein B7Y41_06590 [Hydrogenophilales bacterium 28-61-23]|nr:MAG: hypothetical protein B7Y41_06590 [Hydrogenophilales bacterium 28-61-23]